MRYKYFKFIGLKETTNVVSGIDEYQDIRDMSVSDNLPYDIRNRLRKVAKAVSDAESKVDTNSETLKVFTIPEFYFRPYDANNLDVQTNSGMIKNMNDSADFADKTSYSFNQMLNIYGELMKILKQDKFKDWLFLPGTIFSKLQTPEKTNENTYLNTLPVIWGDINRTATVIQKKLISRIDGAPTDKGLYKSKEFREILHKVGDDQVNIIQMGGLKIGIEICLDHRCSYIDVSKGVLQTLCKGENNLDLQCLIACGMPAHEDSIMTKNRVLMRNDGMPSQPQVELHNSKTKSQTYGNIVIYDSVNIYNCVI